MAGRRNFARKGDVTPMPSALIALVIFLLIIVAAYFLVSRGFIAVEPLVSGAGDCLSNFDECGKIIGAA